MNELVVGGETVTTLNDEHWIRVRQFNAVPDDFIASLERFSFADFRPSGAKGGNLLAFSKARRSRRACVVRVFRPSHRRARPPQDRRFLVKELSRGDHNTLMTYSDEFSRHLSKASPPSLMARFFAHFRLKGAARLTGGSTDCFVAMNNFLPHEVDHAFDLKGCNDDKTLVLHRRKIDKAEADSSHYDAVSVRFSVTPAQHDWITLALRADVALLRRLELMDYSLIIGVRSLTPRAAATDALCASLAAAPPASAVAAPQQPLVCVRGGRVLLLYVGIIDLLQEWVYYKKIAKVIKAAETHKATYPPPK